jgi:protein TonB
VETPPPPPVEPPPVEELVALQGPVEPDFKPPEPEPVVPKKKPKKPKPVEPPPEEVETPEPPPEPVRHRIVGLSLESTVQGGGGPSFAVGTSRMGKTEKRAADPKQASREPAATGTGATGQVQRVAARIPTRDAVFVKPKRLPSKKPAYPETLKARNVEGDVLMRIDIDRAGKVIRAEVLKGSGFREFDETSRKAALAERFTPATRNGRPVAYTLSYTYRFRIEDY